MTNTQIDNIFTYHAPKGTQIKRYGDIRETARAFAMFITANCPESAELTLAIRRLVK